MTEWSLPQLLAGLHDEIHRQLSTARETLAHSVTKGTAAENIWLQLLTYLPQRYQAASAHIVDSNGKFSDQIDIVVFDRQYSPFIFKFHGQTIIPAESVYAVFETKQSINADQVAYAQNKLSTVRALHRTNEPITHAGGTYTTVRPLTHIIGGILTLGSDWSPPLGDSLSKALAASTPVDRLDLGCVAAHGTFGCDKDGCYFIAPQAKPATAFLLDLISRLQALGTVNMIDVRAYAKWLP